MAIYTTATEFVLLIVGYEVIYRFGCARFQDELVGKYAKAQGEWSEIDRDLMKWAMRTHTQQVYKQRDAPKEAARLQQA